MRTVASLVLLAGCQASLAVPVAVTRPAPAAAAAPQPPRTALDRVALAAARSAATGHVVAAREVRAGMAVELGSGLWPYVLAAHGSDRAIESQLASAFAELSATVEIESFGRATFEGPEGRAGVIVALPAPTLPIEIHVDTPTIRVPWSWAEAPAAFAVTPTATRRLPGILDGGTFALSIDCMLAAGTIEINAGSLVVASITNACGGPAIPVEDTLDMGPPARTRVEIEQRLFELANRERRVRGLPALRWDEGVHRFARAHSTEMAGFRFVGHEAADGTPADTRLRKVPARAVYENVGRAAGPGEAHHGFMTSPGHRANLLAVDAERGAIGVVPDPRDPRAYYVTEIFVR